MFTLHYLYIYDSIAYSCCLPDLRREDIRLCLATGCHLSISHPSPFLHVHASLSMRLQLSRVCSPGLRREDIRLCLGASCYIFIHRLPPFLPSRHPLTYISVSFSDIPQHDESGKKHSRVGPRGSMVLFFRLIFSSAVKKAEGAGQIMLWILRRSMTKT